MMIERDMRRSAAKAEVAELYDQLFRPGEGHVWTADDLDVVSGGEAAHFSGQCFEGTLDDGPSSAIYRLDLTDGAVRRVAAGRMFRNASNGRTAFVGPGNMESEQLVVSGPADGPIATIPIAVRIEAMAWSPDGSTLMVLAADPGADLSGLEGGVALRDGERGDAWLPEVMSTDAADLWRRLYRWSEGQPGLAPVTHPPLNVWEFGWLGDDAVVVVASDYHSEGSWYQSSVRVIDAASGAERARHQPAEQAGVPVGAPDGRRWAVIEAFCSDRGLVCGTVMLGEQDACRALDLADVEATDLRWFDSDRLLVTGLRDAQTVVGEVGVSTGVWREIWNSDARTIGGWIPSAVPFGDGAALTVLEAYDQPPVVARLAVGEAHVYCDFAPAERPRIPGTIRYVRWKGRDGLEIGGWLVLPDGEAKNLPLVMDIHGGPVFAYRNRYAGVYRAGPVLVGKGYALFLPNPRGSWGRGQDFARKVRHDMGGEDMHDYLAGIDQLVAEGIVDPARIAVCGSSYGGFMSAWLVTQTRRFAAAAPISPVSNWYGQHFASQIPWFDQAMLSGSPHEPGGQYFERSPVFFAEGATTPTLVLGGGRDKNTPTDQAIELYGALAEAGVEAALAIYPEDGHSLRGFPAYLDSAARIVDWFGRYIKL